MMRIGTLLSALLLAACAMPTDDAQAQVQRLSQRIIVKPLKPISAEELMQQIRRHLPRPERVEFVVAMAEGAYVLRAVGEGAERNMPGLIADLQATQLFEYVEADARMGIRSRSRTQ